MLYPYECVFQISAMDFKTSQYLTIHSKAIRDVCFHPLVDDGILLSCGLDKTVKMTSVMSNAVVQTYVYRDLLTNLCLTFGLEFGLSLKKELKKIGKIKK